MKTSLNFLIEDRKIAHVRLPDDFPSRQNSFELSHRELREIKDRDKFFEETLEIAADSYIFEPEIPEVL